MGVFNYFGEQTLPTRQLRSGLAAPAGLIARP